MNWSFNIGRVSGIALKIHWTFLLLLGWIFAAELASKQSAVLATEGVFFIVVLFGCVLLHELGHALMAKKFGVSTRDITLLPIGGLARLERIPDNPREELWIAIAGPLVNVVIAAVLSLFLGLIVGFSFVLSLEVLAESFLGRLLLVNCILVIFNMLPAFPMDGGRVLRAALAMRYDYVTATETAATIGQMMAIAFGALGLMSNGMLVLIGVFVWFGAQYESGHVRMKALMKGVPVTSAMVRRFRTLKDDDSIGTAAGELLSGDQQDFPVLAAGRLVGVLTRDDLLSAIKLGQLNASVSTIMHSDCPVVSDTDPLEPVVTQLQQTDCHTAPVTHDGALVGVVNLDNVGEWLAIQTAVSTTINKTPMEISAGHSSRSVASTTQS